MAKYVGLGITPEHSELLATENGAIVVSEAGLAILAYQTKNDLTLDETGNLRMVYDAEAVGEHARQRLMFFKGEWFLDPSIGVDWFGQVLGFASSRMQVAEAIVKRVILQTPGVTGLRQVSTTYDRAIRGVRIEGVEVDTEFDEPVIL
ncbi:hypothetical protein FF100_04960 [Methylobacterium terricola]|uniref:Uncharacterized protein n=1 Tax=Methylobacterium terricola TaxID=2583531 RepID=A0A5C4LM22_9HYPH|nr:hypothetical protein [Methylobacterium terricola]TNC14928.1 hypothetical protein FF100_04960 [Methylobacterium terricola]